MEDDLRIERGSGNVFADLDLPNPELALLKADLALQIVRAISDNGWTDDDAARELHVSHATIVAIARGSLTGVSTDQLLRLLQQLDFDVNIFIGPNGSSRRSARIAVHHADAYASPADEHDTIESPAESRQERQRHDLVNTAASSPLRSVRELEPGN